MRRGRKRFDFTLENEWGIHPKNPWSIFQNSCFSQPNGFTTRCCRCSCCCFERIFFYRISLHRQSHNMSDAFIFPEISKRESWFRFSHSRSRGEIKYTTFFSPFGVIFFVEVGRVRRREEIKRILCWQ